MIPPPMPKKPRNDFLDRLLYVALRVVSMALHSFPVEANRRTGELIATRLSRIDRKHRARALATPRRSFPEMPARRRERLARRSQQDLVKLAVEVLFTTRLI